MNSKYKILNPGYSAEHRQFEKGHGNYLFTSDSDRYIDMAMGAGSLIFGHADPDVSKAIEQQAARSPIFLQNNGAVQALTEGISKVIPDYLSNFVYCNTGSEATQRAVRLARAATGKMHIASFQGGWHGMNEWTLLDDGGRFGATPITSYAGIPNVALQYSMLLPYNEETIWEILAQNADKLAAVIIEPIQGSNPQQDIANFLTKLISTCKHHGILVIFDEVITGFRISKGGATELFGLDADIVTYGKVIGGGLPMGIVAFSEEIFDRTFACPEKSILTGGTFSANPLSSAAGLATLNKLSFETYEHLQQLSEYFRDRLNKSFLEAELPFSAGGFKSVNRVYFTNKSFKNRQQRDALEMAPNLQARFRTYLWDKKIIWPGNGIVCLPTTQTKEILDYVADEVLLAAKLVTSEM